MVIKLKEINRNPNFAINLKRLLNVIKKVVYSVGIMLQSACLVVNPITVYSYVVLFSARPFVRHKTKR